MEQLIEFMRELRDFIKEDPLVFMVVILLIAVYKEYQMIIKKNHIIADKDKQLHRMFIAMREAVENGHEVDNDTTDILKQLDKRESHAPLSEDVTERRRFSG